MKGRPFSILGFFGHILKRVYFLIKDRGFHKPGDEYDLCFRTRRKQRIMPINAGKMPFQVSSIR